jgi:hypothetical protein
VDHAASYVHVEHQVGFSAVETIRAKQGFERLCMDNGVVVQDYLTDSGAFKANSFVAHTNETHQKLSFCGTNAHHQNGVAERSIQTISNMARAMILHSSIHWKDGCDSSLWPMAVEYAAHIYNNTPHNVICPADIFTGSTVSHHRLLDYHVWGCPVYVLDPKMQSGKKLPRWEPRSRGGMFMGLSRQHASEVHRVLNLSTGSITTQYHVVFDDLFTTVSSVDRDHAQPDHWEDLCLENSTQITVDNPPDYLADEWLTREELDEKRRELDRQEIRLTSARGVQVSRINHVPLLPSQPRTPPHEAEPSINEGNTPQTSTFNPPSVATSTLPDPFPTTVKTEGAPVLPTLAPAEAAAQHPITGERRSSRTTVGRRQTPRYTYVFVSKVDTFAKDDGHTANVAYLAELHTDQDTGEVDISDPRVYAAKRRSDPDMPTFHEAMKGENAAEYVAAMKIEVKGLLNQKTWTTRPRSEATKVVKSTWVFKLKRLPDGTP